MRLSIIAGTIHGFVRDDTNSEPIIMGNVWIQDTHLGTTTNLKGYYVISDLPPGDYVIIFRYIGYQTVSKNFQSTRENDIEMNVSLKPQDILMKAAEVTAERDKRKLDIMPGQITIQVPQLKTIPQVAESDLFRAIQMLPGVATLSDFSAGLYVRGGSADQNLILLDEIDVYNPNHMFGFFSTFSTDAVKSVEILKGGFPARYGGRLSSVLNVYNNEGNRQKFEGIARLSMISASSTLQGPWKHGSWMISGRRTYFDLAGKLANQEIPYYFYDGHAKFNVDMDDKNQASISFYAGNDLLDMSAGGSTAKVDWGNRTFSAQWTHLFNSKLFSHFVLAGSRYKGNSQINFEDIKFGTYNEILDMAFKGMITYTPNLTHSLDFGFESKLLHFKLDYYIVDNDYVNKFSGTYLSAYVQDNIKLTPLTIIQSGLRLDHYTDGTYTRFDPRLSIKQLLSDQFNVTLSYGLYHQFLNLVQQEGLSFADMWFPVDRTFEPGSAHHVIAGLHFDNRSSFSFDLETYMKDYRSIAEYRIYRSENEALDEQTAASNFLRGIGKAYGMDLYIRNRIGRLEGWLGYSLGWTEKKVKGYNFDRWYYPTYDRRHTITLIQDYKLNRKWRFNCAFKYGSGQPYTEPTAWYEVTDEAGRTHYEALEGEKNFYRLPAYHRLDLGLFYTSKLFGKQTEYFVQAVNIYNRKNVWIRTYDTSVNPAVQDDFTMLPFLPTAGMIIKF